MRALVCLLAVGGLIGLSTNLAKLAAEAGVAPLAQLAWSLSAASMLLALAGGLRGRGPDSPPILRYSLEAGLVSMAAPNLILFAAIPRVGAAYAILAMAFPPFLTYLGALLLGVERPQARRALGVALSLVGALVLALYKLDDPAVSGLWVAATLVVPVLLAAGNLYRTLRWPVGATSPELAVGMLGASGVLLVIVGLVATLAGVQEEGLALTVPLATKPVLIVALQSLVFASTYWIFFVLQRVGGPVYLSLLGSVACVVGVPLAVVLFDEPLPEGLWTATALITVGVALLTVPGRARTSPPSRGSAGG